MAKKQEFYLGNENLPTTGVQFNWTPEMVDDLDKCRKSILQFSKHFTIVNLDKGKIKIDLRDYQKRILKSLSKHRMVAVLASRQCGKALDLNTPIKTPNGWTTMGALKDNDQVYDEAGNICNVVAAHEPLYNRNCYKVIFDNGEEIIADEEHLWFTQTQSDIHKKLPGAVRTTTEILNTLNIEEPNHRIPIAKPLVGENKTLPIEPYLYGVQLCNNISDATIYIQDYLNADYNSRLEVLRGIMDTDGDIDKKTGRYFFVILSKFAECVYELLAGLGYKVHTKNVLSGEKYTEYSFFPNRPQYHYIKKIEPVESRPVRCITVDSPNHLYLCGKQLISTHNSTLMTIYALWTVCFKKDQRILIIANKEKTAIQIFGRVRLAYEKLPNYLKPGVATYGKTEITLGNGSSIGISTTSSSAARGDSVNCLTGDSIIVISAADGFNYELDFDRLTRILKHD